MTISISNVSVLSADGSKVYRNDTERFPYECYYEHCWAPHDPTVPPGEVTCDPFSNPNPQYAIISGLVGPET